MDAAGPRPRRKKAISEQRPPRTDIPHFADGDGRAGHRKIKAHRAEPQHGTRAPERPYPHLAAAPPTCGGKRFHAATFSIRSLVRDGRPSAKGLTPPYVPGSCAYQYPRVRGGSVPGPGQTAVGISPRTTSVSPTRRDHCEKGPQNQGGRAPVELGEQLLHQAREQTGCPATRPTLARAAGPDHRHDATTGKRKPLEAAVGSFSPLGTNAVTGPAGRWRTPLRDDHRSLASTANLSRWARDRDTPAASSTPVPDPP